MGQQPTSEELMKAICAEKLGRHLPDDITTFEAATRFLEGDEVLCAFVISQNRQQGAAGVGLELRNVDSAGVYGEIQPTREAAYAASQAKLDVGVWCEMIALPAAVAAFLMNSGPLTTKFL